VSYPNVKLSGRAQFQGYFFDNQDPTQRAAGVQGGTSSNIFARRIRVEAKGQINEYISFSIQPSFENGRIGSSANGGSGTGVRLRDAYIDLRFQPETAATLFTLRVGQEKRPFGRYELTSSNNLPSIERGAGRGLIRAASNDLFGTNGFLSHDVGASATIDIHRKVSLKAGVYNGQGESASDINGKKSFGLRGTAAVLPKLNVGASFFSHDALQPAVTGTDPLPADSSFTNRAWGLDAQWGKPGDAGLFLVADYMRGQDATRAKQSISGLSLVGAYNIRVASPNSWLYAIEPSVRFDQADPNTDVSGNKSTLMTAALGFYMSSKAQFRIGYERQSFENSAIKAINGVRTAMTVNF
jgi:hypothetical protein